MGHKLLRRAVGHEQRGLIVEDIFRPDDARRDLVFIQDPQGAEHALPLQLQAPLGQKQQDAGRRAVADPMAGGDDAVDESDEAGKACQEIQVKLLALCACDGGADDIPADQSAEDQ